MFSYRPGHGAPTIDIRKKKFTEHQLDRRQRKNQDDFNWEGEEQVGGQGRDYHRMNEETYDSQVGTKFH